MKKALIVDIDSTIWDINDLCIPASAKLYPEIGPYTREELTHWYSLKEKYGDNFFDIYVEGLRKELIPERKLFPHVGESLLKLREMGYIIHFITHNEAVPHEMEIYLEKWIHDNIPELNFYLTVLNNQESKIDFANSLIIYEVGLIIDDKPKTIEESIEKGFPVLAKFWPFNINTIESYDNAWGFEDWTEVPNLVENAIEKKLLVNSH